MGTTSKEIGSRILTKAGDKFVFDYPKRDKYGRFIIRTGTGIRLNGRRSPKDGASAVWMAMCSRSGILQYLRLYRSITVNGIRRRR